MARRELDPAALAVVRAVDNAVQPADSALLVACSGGADSLALAAGAVRVAARRSLPLAAVVVDHGLQADSADVATSAAGQLRGLGILDVVVRTVTVAVADPSGPEAAARTARYAALEEEAATRSATVLLGHTLDDQAETVLLGLARGSGVRSLAGMAVRTGRCLRPLLGLRHAVMVAACAEQNLHPWSDPHNDLRAYARVRVRQAVLPVLEAELGPGISVALARTATLLRSDAELLDHLAAAADPGTADLDCAQLASLHPAVRRRVLLRWLRRRGGRDVTAEHVLRIEELITAWHGQKWLDLPGVAVRRSTGRLVADTRTGSGGLVAG